MHHARKAVDAKRPLYECYMRRTTHTKSYFGIFLPYRSFINCHACSTFVFRLNIYFSKYIFFTIYYFVHSADTIIYFQLFESQIFKNISHQDPSRPFNSIKYAIYLTLVKLYRILPLVAMWHICILELFNTFILKNVLTINVLQHDVCENYK